MRATLLLTLLTIPALAAPPDVPIIKPVERDVFDHEDFTGRTEASTTVEIRARLNGLVDKVSFKDGAAVKKGDVLFQLDDRLQRAELAKAQAEVIRAEAGLKRAEADLARVAKAVEAKVATREELDKAAAMVEEQKSALLVARAALDVGKLNLEYAQIKSPVDGRIGRANAAAGTFLRDADVLATVYTLDPMYVFFDLDERTALRLMRYTRDRREPKITVGLALTGDEGFPRKAAVDFVDPSVDPKTGTLRVRGVFPNPKEEVRPGQFVRVRVPLGDARKALLLPEQAIRQSRPDGHSVLVVNGKNVIEERRVRIGPVTDTFVEIMAGLKLDDRVVRDPARLTAGEEVKPVPAKETTVKPGGLGQVPQPPRPPQDFPGTAPAVILTATYPGANSHVVEDTVAAPIGEQINGLEKMTNRVHSCSDDGTMKMTLLFEPGTDLTTAMVLAQKRISQAEPVLPEEVRRQGITIRKRGVHLAAVALVSPNDRYDLRYLTNYARIQLRDELARVAGVADVSFFGDTDPGRQLRLVLDRNRLEAFDLTTIDVVRALRDQGLTLEALPGRQPALLLSGRIPEPDAFKELIIKANKEGAMIRLAAVASLEEVQGWNQTVGLNGKPCAMLLVSRLPDADAKKTARALRERLAELSKRLPDGLEVKTINEP